MDHGVTVQADLSNVREPSATRILRRLFQEGARSRADLAKELGLNRSTVTHVVRDLVSSGYVCEVGVSRHTGGRPGIPVVLDPHGGGLIGVEINIDVVNVVLTDFAGGVLWSRGVETLDCDELFAELDAAESLVDEAVAQLRSAGIGPLLGIGVAVAALVAPGEGRIVYSPFLGWRDVDLKSRWAQRFGCRIVVENEANAAALGEHHFGVARRVNDFVFVSVGVGLAIGVFVNGILLRGVNGFAGQAGHTVTNTGGQLCRCGRRGCWVTEVGLDAISERLRKRADASGCPAVSAADKETPTHMTIRALEDAVEAKDSAVLNVLEETGRHMGAGIADLINLLDPSLVVLGGALSGLAGTMLPSVQEAVENCRLAGKDQQVVLRASSLGSRACTLGATAAVLGRFLDEFTLPNG